MAPEKRRKPLIEPGSILPSSTGAEDGLMSRVIERDRLQSGRLAPEATEEVDVPFPTPSGSATLPTREEIGETAEAVPYDKSYDNMTSHTTDLPTSQTENQAEGRLADQTGGHTAIQPAIQQTDQPSIRQAILASVQQAGQAGEMLKTVTIKLAPWLDRRVEEHCFTAGRKKQEVVRDALLLYFDLLEGERGEGVR